VHTVGLMANQRQLGRIINGFRSGIHIALTARCEFYSRPLAGLKDAECGGPERNHQQKSPTARMVSRNQSDCCQHRPGQQDQSEVESLATLGRTNVSDLPDCCHRRR